MQATQDDRYARGWRKLQEIVATQVSGLSNRCATSRRTSDGSLWSFRSAIFTAAGTRSRSREIATVAALAAMGNATAQLKVHLHAALNVNVSREELIEVIIQMAIYAGFPAALNAMFAAKEVFAERKKRVELRLGSYTIT